MYKFCECGCGTKIPAINKKKLPARFLHGHNNRDVTKSFSTISKLSSAIEKWHKENKGTVPYKNRYKKISISNKGRIWGIPFKEGHQTWNKGKLHLTKERNPNWKGGKAFMGGYWFIRVATGNYKKLSRINMEKHLRRNLSSNDIVHHVNGDKTDDRIENLQLMTRKEHINLHHH